MREDRIACHALTHEGVCLKIKDLSSELVIKACTLRSLAGVTARRIVEVIGNEFLPKTICSPKTE